MIRKLRNFALPVLLVLMGLVFFSWLSTSARVGAGMTARVVCALAHHTGLDPDWVMSHYVNPLLGFAAPLVSVQWDADMGVAESHAAHLADARAIVREGVGCTLVLDEDEGRLRLFHDPPHAQPFLTNLPWPEGDAPLDVSTTSALMDAVDAAFAEPEGRPGRLRQTLAILIVHQGHLIAERYALGVNAKSRLLSWSAAKSVLAALVGVAELEGRLVRAEPALVPEWRGAGDPRGAITTDQLLRMSSGLAFDENYGAINDVSRMIFSRPDAGEFAANMDLAHPPDTAWAYSSGTSNILARSLRDVFDGDLEALVHWSRGSFFDPVGMHSAVFETDTSGSFVGSSLFFATGRDWARFGQLHLQNGIWKGRRILPEDWVRYVSTPTAKAPQGRYGAGWWLNAGDADDPTQRMWPTIPRDVYTARGMSGQYVVIVPSAELVIVRFGLSQAEDDALQGIESLVRSAIDAVSGTSID